MKSGNYALYKGREFEYYSNMFDNTITIISEDPDVLNLGFIIRHGIYVKDLNRNEVEELYAIRTYGIYKGQSVGIRAEENDKYHIEATGSEGTYERLGFDRIERGVYRKWVGKKDLEKVWEVKTLL